MRITMFCLAIAIATEAFAVAQSPLTKSATKPKDTVPKSESLQQRPSLRRRGYARRVVRSGRPYVCYYYVQPPYYQYYCQPTGRYVYPMGYRYYYYPRGGGSYYQQVGPYYWYYHWR